MQKKITIKLIIAVFAAVLILTGNSAFAAELGLCEVNKIVDFEVISASGDGIKINLSGGDKKADFFPQSFDISKDSIYMLNRYEPAAAVYNLKDKKKTFINFNHPADKKFGARFFIDIEMNDDSMYLLEQSTASIRKSDLTGKIDSAFFLSDSSDAQILKFFKLSPSTFLVLDNNAKSGFTFDIAKYDEKNISKSISAKFACGSENITAANDQLLILKPDLKGNIEAMITPCCETEEINVPKSWKGYKIVAALGCGKDNDFYIYSEKDEKCYIESIIKDGNKYRVKVYELKEKLYQSEYSTRHCRVKGLNDLIILNCGEKKIEFVEAILK